MEEHEEIDSRNFPIVHSPVEVSACPECQKECKETYFFNPECECCQGFLSEHASIGEMFSILRQWTPAVQQSVHLIIGHMLEAGTHVNDRDGLTDMTMLQYVVKSGAKGIGEIQHTIQALKLLLLRGADPFIRCRWTNMTAFHYAVYFNVEQALVELLKNTMAVEVDSRCCEFDNGTPLHIAVRCGSLESMEVLLQHHANPCLTDSTGRTPLDFLNDEEQEKKNEDDEMKLKREKMRALLQSSSLPTKFPASFVQTTQEIMHTARQLDAMGLCIGDRVLVSGTERGTLRYCGPTLFASGIWAGVELDEGVGKNNGSINNIYYFKCPPGYGIFAPLSKVSNVNTKNNNERRSVNGNNGYQDNYNGEKSINQSGVISQAKIDNSFVDVNNNKHNNLNKHSLNTDSDNSDFYSSFNPNNLTNTTYVKQNHSTNVNLNKTLPNKRYINKSEDTQKRSFHKNHQNFFKPPHDNDEQLDVLLSSNKRSVSISSTTDKVFYDNNGNCTYPSVTPRKAFSKVDLRHVTSKVNSGLRTSKVELSGLMEEVEVGERVLVAGERIGVLKYVGETVFAPGLWYGIELMNAVGKNDGSINGVRYFECRPRHGIFAPPSRVHRLSDADFFELQKSQAMKDHFNDQPLVEVPTKSFNRVKPFNFSKFFFHSIKTSTGFDVGCHVFYNGEIGTVHYIGGLDFKDGVWVGVELRSAKGRHDGLVRGKRYFTCRPNHGLLVRPNKLFVRGINAAKLIATD